MMSRIQRIPTTEKFIIGATALKRWGRMEEIQGLPFSLASERRAAMFTGSILGVDGGWTGRNNSEITQRLIVWSSAPCSSRRVDDPSHNDLPVWANGPARKWSVT